MSLISDSSHPILIDQNRTAVNRLTVAASVRTPTGCAAESVHDDRTPSLRGAIGAPFHRRTTVATKRAHSIDDVLISTMTIVVLFIVLVSIVLSIRASAIGPIGLRPRAINYARYLERTHDINPRQSGSAEQWFHHQMTDHFDAENSGMFAQRFFVNNTFWQTPTGPIFLYIGGEGAVRPKDVIVGHHMELASQHGALVFAVEHRFYGATYPTSNMTSDNLRVLSSQQALADLALFIDFARSKYGFDHRNTVISFGGSYSGALSAWMRIKYPHLVHAAVASSAPVKAVVEFVAYDDVVKRSLLNPIVGGSLECAVSVNAAFQDLDQAIKLGELSKLERLFGSCSSLTSADTVVLADELSSIFQGSVQYNSQVNLGIKEVCNVMIQHAANPIRGLAHLSAMVREEDKLCTDFSHDVMIEELKDFSVEKEGGVGMRQWLYQTCSQFGYYQTCGTPDCIFSKQLLLQSDLGLCQELFDISPETISARVAFSNDYYGGDMPAGSQILFINGDIDPWHALSVLEDDPEGFDITSVFMQGTSHCQNMQSSKESDLLELKRGRDIIEYKLKSWINQHQYVSAPTAIVISSF